MKFEPRMSKPEKGNLYYVRKANGGYSAAIKGYPTDKDCEVLSNCVGYAYGRFNEIGEYGCCKYLAPVNAERFMQYKGNLKTGFTPQIGACMVWQKGGTLNGEDGAGHVAIVEKVITDTEIVTSESTWGGKAFTVKTRRKGAGNWGMGDKFKFLGFIYNPAPCCKVTDTVHVVRKGDTLSGIAKKYGTTYQKLAQYNGISDPNFLRVGQKIKIPENTKTDVIYTVKKGDTLIKIANAHGTTAKILASYNNIKNSSLIRVGQIIKIPVK